MKESLKNIANYLVNRPFLIALIIFAFGVIHFLMQTSHIKKPLNDASDKLYKIEAIAKASKQEADSLRTELQKSTVQLAEAKKLIQDSQAKQQTLQLNYYQQKKSNPVQIDSLKNYLLYIKKIQTTL